MAEGYKQLADLDMLEQSPSNRMEAMHHARLQPFWVQSEQKEMDGLWHRKCFKHWKQTALLPNDSVFGQGL